MVEGSQWLQLSKFKWILVFLLLNCFQRGEGYGASCMKRVCPEPAAGLCLVCGHAWTEFLTRVMDFRDPGWGFSHRGIDLSMTCLSGMGLRQEFGVVYPHPVPLSSSVTPPPGHLLPSCAPAEAKPSPGQDVAGTLTVASPQLWTVTSPWPEPGSL